MKVVKIMKKLWKWLKCEMAWYLSPKVLEAINRGATYEEVLKIVELEAGNTAQSAAELNERILKL